MMMGFLSLLISNPFHILAIQFEAYPSSLPLFENELLQYFESSKFLVLIISFPTRLS